MRSFIISPEGLPYIFIGMVITGLTALVSPLWSLGPLVLTLFTICFFRNPQRKVEINDNNILSPADGKVLSIEKLNYDDILKCQAYKISIFLSIFNVHVNRVPISGTVFYKKYVPGKFFPAFKSHASAYNERNIIGINYGNLNLLVIQITGFIARRIVDWIKVGEYLPQGNTFGLIKFGSCTEIVIPANQISINVTVGDKVKGGKTIIGVITNETSG
ncbi:MAG: phosphatidylserine decarboxylase family protein [Bacillota bacterium]